MVVVSSKDAPTAEPERQPALSYPSFQGIKLLCADIPDSMVGALNITEDSLKWTATVSDGQEQISWSKAFKEINLHAMATDEGSGYPPCIYVQMGEDCTEVRLVPQSTVDLKDIYDALCAGVARNSDDEDVDEGGLGAMLGLLANTFDDTHETEAGLEGANEMLQRLDGLLEVPPEHDTVIEESEGPQQQNGTSQEGNGTT